MICWECKRVFGVTDIRKHAENATLKQTEYKCTNCGTVYFVSERRLSEPTVENFEKNEPHS